MDHYHGNGQFPYFFSPRKFKLSERQKVLKQRNLVLSSQQYNYSRQDLVLHVKGYRSKFADGRRILQIFTKRRSVRSFKETMPYNKQLTNLTSSGPHWRILALCRFARTSGSITSVHTTTTSGQYSPVLALC